MLLSYVSLCCLSTWPGTAAEVSLREGARTQRDRMVAVSLARNGWETHSLSASRDSACRARQHGRN